MRQKHDESLRDYVKHFCHVRNAIPCIQDIERISAFCDGVSDIKTVGEITMKKSKTVADLLVVTDICIDAFEARARLLESRARGTHARRRIMRSTQLTEPITRTKETADIMASCPRSRRRRGLSSVLMTWRSGEKFTAPWGMIWKSARLFLIGRRCHHQQRSCHRSPGGSINVR
jgi:hypothetical protein